MLIPFDFPAKKITFIRTPQVFRLIPFYPKVLKSSDKKKEVENDLLSCLAPQVGLEPTTYGLTVRRSNQLSY